MAKSKNATTVSMISGRTKSDIEIIKESIIDIMSDKESLKKTLIASGVYDKNLKLTASYR